MAGVETLTASRNLLSPHGETDYPGLLTYRVSGWPSVFVIPEPGQTIVALGGEEAYGYETTGGVRADPIRLAKGDRATVASWDASAFLAVWRVERAE
jgi:hypothetical protein